MTRYDGWACWARGARSAPRCAGGRGADDLELVAEVDVDDELEALVRAGAEAVVDFTHPDVVMDNLEFCIDHGIHAVVGTTGFDEDRLDQLRGLAGRARRGGRAGGAQLLDRCGADDAVRRGGGPFFESVEIVELHHPDKADAPSRHRPAYGGADRGGPPRGRAAGRCPTPPPPAWRAPAAPTSTASTCTALRLRGLVAHQEVHARRRRGRRSRSGTTRWTGSPSLPGC